MAVIGNLTADLRAESGAFNRDMTRASRNLRTNTAVMNRSLAALSRGFQGVRGQITSIGRGLMSMRTLVAGVAAGALVAAGRASLQAADDMAKLADQVGLTVEGLSALEFQASQTGAADGLATGLRTLVNNVGQLREGLGMLRSFLRNYDQDLLRNIETARTTAEVIDLIADAIANEDDVNRRAALSRAAFGRAGSALVNTFRDGQAGIRAYREEAERLGIVLSDGAARSAERVNDRIDQLSRQLRMQFTVAVANSADLIEGLVDRFSRSIPTLVRWGEALADALGMDRGMPRTMDGLTQRRNEVGQLTLALRAMAEVQNELGRDGVVRAGNRRELRRLPAVGDLNRLLGEQVAERAIAQSRLQRNPVNDALGIGRDGANFAPIIEALQAAHRNLTAEIERLQRNLEDEGEDTGSGFGNGFGRGLTDSLADATDPLAEFMGRVAEFQRELDANREALRSQAQAMFTATRTPVEAYRAELEAIRDLERTGVLAEFGGSDTAMRARIAALIDMAGATQDLSAAMAELQGLAERGLINSEHLADARAQIDAMRNDLPRVTPLIEDLRQAGSGLIRDWQYELESFTSGFQSMGDTVRGVLASVFRQMQQMMLRRWVFSPLERGLNSVLDGIAGGSGSAVTNVFKGAPKFQRGGGFRVGGAGGVDSQLVSFFATPGEDVEVTPRGAAGRRGGRGSGTGAGLGPIIVNQTFELRAEGAVMTEQLIGQFQAQVAQAREAGARDGANMALQKLRRGQRYAVGG